MTLRIGSLCSGYGGIDIAVEEFFGATTAWHCEWEAAPSKILAHHWNVPNHHDLTTTDWDAVEPIDILTAGWPCQPWSVAGRQKGADDERAIWPSVADAICCLRPGIVVLENVPAIVVLGELARAVGDLAAIGYDARWQCVRASDVGAPHRRERCFIVAQDTYGTTCDQRGQSTSRQAQGGWTRANLGRRGGASSADSRCAGSQGVRTIGRASTQPQPLGGVLSAADADNRASDGEWARSESGQGGSASPNAAGVRWREGWAEPARVIGGPDAAIGGDTDWGVYTVAVRRWERVTGRPAPAPTQPGRNGPRLSPLLVEFMMGLPAGWVTSPDIGLTRNEQLKALGNGVVPQQAMEALRRLCPVEMREAG